MTILITGVAGFIGFHTAKKLLENGKNIIGIDNYDKYYDVKLKKKRISILNNHKFKKKFIFVKLDLVKLFKKYKIKKIINLAAQAGVRHSLINPKSYIKSNLVGFANILELCRNFKINHLTYASTSSVYGANTKQPFSEKDGVDHPLQLYAATKRANELMAHSYSNLFNLPTTGLRFFTVYGPWGRPDMALFIFTKNILNNKVIKVFNNGKHIRDFTYIDDIVDGIIKANDENLKKNKKINFKTNNPSTSKSPFKIYNIGNSNAVSLMKYIKLIEKYLGKKAKKKFLKLQRGDVPKTLSDISKIKKDLNYNPKTSVEEGVKNFINWYKKFYKYSK
jgi:UDP-glucuronate 4-epimerase